jgi:hypothetical protein
MSQRSIVGSPIRRPSTYVAAVAGALLGAGVFAAPARSGEFDGYGPYSTRYDAYYQRGGERYAHGPAAYGYRGGYRPSCVSCGCGRCGCGWRCRPMVESRGHIIERRVVEREYYERRYAVGGSSRPYWHTESRWPRYPVPSGYEEARPAAFPYGYGGVRWRSPEPGPYEYEEPPRPPAPVWGWPNAYYDGNPE